MRSVTTTEGILQLAFYWTDVKAALSLCFFGQFKYIFVICLIHFTTWFLAFFLLDPNCQQHFSFFWFKSVGKFLSLFNFVTFLVYLYMFYDVSVGLLSGWLRRPMFTFKKIPFPLSARMIYHDHVRQKNYSCQLNRRIPTMHCSSPFYIYVQIHFSVVAS